MLSILEGWTTLFVAIGGALGTGGFVALVKAWRNPHPKPGTPDAAAVALAENTAAVRAMAEALKGQNTHFAANNKMFEAMGPLIATILHDTAENKAHLAAIRDAMNRQGR